MIVALCRLSPQGPQNARSLGPSGVSLHDNATALVVDQRLSLLPAVSRVSAVRDRKSLVPMASTTAASSLRPHTVMAEAKHDEAHIRSTQVGISGESLEGVMAPAPAFILLQNCRGLPAAVLDAKDLVWKKTSFRCC